MRDPLVRSEPIEALDRRYRALRVPPGAARRAALAASLERFGQQQPVLATDGVEKGRLVLLDGFKRLECLERLGVERVSVSVVRLDGKSSLGALAAANRGHQSALSDLEEAWIIARLEREHGLSQTEIAALLGRHPSWVSRRKSLCERLERAVQDDVRLGLVSTSAAREIARLPRGTQAAAAKAVSAFSLVCSQVRGLVAALREARDPDERRLILSDPLAHLPPPPRARAGPAAPDGRLGRVGNRVREQLVRIHAAASRLDEILLEQSGETVSARERTLLLELSTPILEKARAALGRVEALVVAPAEETAHAR